MVVRDGGERDSAYYSVIDDEWPAVKRHLAERLDAALALTGRMAGSRTARRLACALALAALVPVGRGARRHPSASARRRQCPPGPRFVGTVPAATRMHVTVALRPRDPRRWPPTPTRSRRPARPTTAATSPRLSSRAASAPPRPRSAPCAGRCTPTASPPDPVSRGALSISVVASAARFERAFSVSLTRMALRGGRMAIRASAAPAVPAALAGAVAVGGGPQHHRVAAAAAGPGPAGIRAGRPAGPRPTWSPAARSRAPPPRPPPRGQHAFTADQIASAYGFSGLYGAGDGGGGVTVAVYELEPDDPADIAAYQSCYGTHATISYVPVDAGRRDRARQRRGGARHREPDRPGPQRQRARLPGARTPTRAPPGSGPYDTFSAIVNQDRARVVTVSWGQCEAMLGQADASAENTLFQQATVQGQSIVAASRRQRRRGLRHRRGASADPGRRRRSLQPAVRHRRRRHHAVGARAAADRERAGTAAARCSAACSSPAPRGGGISRLWPMPSPQLDSAAALNVRTAQAAGSACGHPGGFCREVPDVAADGDPATGYLIYWNGTRRRSPASRRAGRASAGPAAPRRCGRRCWR